MAMRDAQPETWGEGGDSHAAPRATSLLRHAPAAVLVAILIADSNRHTDPDLWGHIRFGQAFIGHRALIDRDVYSYSAAGHLWRDHEWLAEIVMAVAYDLGGVIGLKLWKFACTALTVLFVADAEALTGASAPIQLAVILVLAFGLIMQTMLRPQMFTLVGFSLLIAFLARDTYRRDARLWLIVPLMALWANLHGGFFIGLVAVAVYAAVSVLVDLAAGVGARRGVGLLLLTIAATAATLVNPYGIGMWETVAHALRNPYTRNVVRDWQPLGWTIRAQWHSAPSGVVLFIAAIGMVVAAGVAAAASPSTEDLPLVAVAAVMAIAAWLSARNVALAAVAASVPLARHLELLRQRARAPAETAHAWRPAGHLVAFGLAVALASSGGLLSSRLAADRGYPSAALAFMRAHGLHGNVLCEFGWGEYLIWHAAPADKVFIDGRYDTVYPLAVIGDYVEFYFDQSRAAAVLDAWPHNFVLIGPQTPARRLMERRRDWKLIYRDSDALLYARAGSSAARLPGIPVEGRAGPGLFP